MKRTLGLILWLSLPFPTNAAILELAKIDAKENQTGRAKARLRVLSDREPDEIQAQAEGLTNKLRENDIDPY